MGALFFYTTGALLMDAPYPSPASAAAFATGLDLLLVGACQKLEQESTSPRRRRAAAKPRARVKADTNGTSRVPGAARGPSKS
jgi:hypothetical protein